MEDKSKVRSEKFQQTPTHCELKQSREFFAINLRKKKRIENLNKKRATANPDYAQISGYFIFPIESIPVILISAIGEFKNTKLNSIQRLFLLTELIPKAKAPIIISSLLETLYEVTEKSISLPYNEIFHSNQVIAFMKILKLNDVYLKILSLKIIYKACMKSLDVANRFKENMIIEEIIGIINFGYNKDIKEYAYKVIKSIIGDSIENRDYVIKSGILENCIKDIKNPDINIKLACFWVLRKLVSFDILQYKEICEKFFYCILESLSSDNNEILYSALLIVFYISKSFENVINFIYTTDYLKIIMSFFNNRNHEIVVVACKIVGNVIENYKEKSMLLVDYGILNIILIVIKNTNSEVKCEFFLLLRKILENCDQTVKAVLDNEIILVIIDNVTSANYKIKFNAIVCVCCIASTKDIGLLRKVLDFNVMEIMVKGLGGGNCEQHVIVLKALHNIFFAVKNFVEGEKWENFKNIFIDLDGISKLEDMMNSRDDIVKSEALNILVEYFSNNQLEDSSLNLQMRPITVFNFD
ncbi:hypothetical protein SteCoe_23783 [Stentor coeruleus]|uniref:Importin subunit alpha n=1 Tax=Stentor coeruleus TaxID=5963 RepID=A0A1R2BJ19_9CILI|nr:hypothetical protein SteCoe_23783 [Stentor coeruleus]